MIYKAKDLFEKLTAEQTEGHYFRGQARKYPGPLFPSAYRGNYCSADAITITHAPRLRGTATQFYLRTNYLDSTGYTSQEAYDARLEWLNRRIHIRRHLTTVFGYPLGESFCQQTGISSEGLDVTTNIQVAFFFALHDWDGKKFIRAKGHDEPRIIYRWNFSVENWSLDSLNKYDFFSCPPIIPVYNILDLFEQCADEAETKEALQAYAKTINWTNLFFDLEAIRGKRPFHLIRFPSASIRNSRIKRQEAALLLPDTVLAKDFLETHEVRSQQIYEEINNGIFLEDLAENPACEKFYFQANEPDEMSLFDNLTPDKYFPQDEMLFQLLRGWVAEFNRNPYGLPAIDINYPTRSMEIIQRTRDDLESEFFI